MVPAARTLRAANIRLGDTLTVSVYGREITARVAVIRHVDFGAFGAGFPLVLNFFSAWAPQGLVDAVAGLSFMTHYASIDKGVIDLRDLIYFLLVIAFWLYASAVVIDLKKAD